MDKLTAHDLEWLRTELADMHEEDPDAEEGGYRDVMTSIGYVALWNDGDVEFFGQIIANVGD